MNLKSAIFCFRWKVHSWLFRLGLKSGSKFIWSKTQKEIILFHLGFSLRPFTLSPKVWKFGFSRCNRPIYWGWTWQIDLGIISIVKYPQ